jgi:anaerobic selenocysteine-containing dehydrogenase
MGFTEDCFRDTPQEMLAQALNLGPDGHSTAPHMEHITLDDLREKGHIPVALHREGFLPFTEGTLPTPSGKIEFYSEVLAAQGSDPLPAFIPATESRWSEAAKQYPLEFLPRKADNYMNSTFANLDGHRKMQSKTNNKLEMHPEDAKARNISNGDTVRIWNDRGSIELTALVDGTVPAGVVAASLDWAKLSPGGANINALTSERLTDLGAAATFYSTLVEVERA